MKTGTGGLKDGSGNVVMICVSESEGADVLRMYRAVNQNVLRFDIVADLDSAILATTVYGAGTKWCVAGNTPSWFTDTLRARYNQTFGAQNTVPQAIAAYTDEYAIDPKRLT